MFVLKYEINSSWEESVAVRRELDKYNLSLSRVIMGVTASYCY